ncbi:MAG: hypothetical protein IJ672_03380 [Methanobrevibacter sp.]|nr:hypothetical protein [Methanobrevibacter sp.]
MNKEYYGLTTWDFWSMEDDLRQVLESKGYGLINFDLTYNGRGQLAPCFEVSTDVAGKLAGEIRKNGFIVEVLQRRDKPSFSRIFIKNTYPVELLPIVDSFDEVMV